jgi:hypothetical protein
LETLLAQKKQFEGQKSCLKYLGGAAGPKRQFERILIKNSLKGVSIPCSTNHIPNVRQKTESSKNSAYVWVAQKRGAQKHRWKPNQEIIRVQGVHTFETRKNSYQSLPFESKRIILPKEPRHC